MGVSEWPRISANQRPTPVSIDPPSESVQPALGRGDYPLKQPMGETTMTIGKRIKQAREAVRLTQQEVADAVGVSRNSVAQWEIGASRPAQERLVPLTKTLNVELGWLMADDGSGTRKTGAQDPQKEAREVELIRIIRDAALELDDLKR